MVNFICINMLLKTVKKKYRKKYSHSGILDKLKKWLNSGWMELVCPTLLTKMLK